VVSSTPRPHFTPGKDPVPILKEAGWAPGPVWKGGKFRLHRVSIPDCPARSSVAIPTELPGANTHEHTHTHTYIYIYIYICVCVCVCVCVYVQLSSAVDTRPYTEIDQPNEPVPLLSIVTT